MLSATCLISNFLCYSWGTPVIREIISYVFYHAHKLSIRLLSLSDLRMSRSFFASFPPSLLRVLCGWRVCPHLCWDYLGIPRLLCSFSSKRPCPSGRGQNIPNGGNIICVPANGALPKWHLAINNSLHIWSMKHKLQLTCIETAL